MRLGLELGAEDKRCLAVGLCGLMHDLGMLKVPEEILQEGQLSAKGMEILKRHPLESRRILEDFGSAFAWVGRIVVQVHERRDGSGYPRGLSREEIHEIAQLVGLADAYLAMAHPRADRPGLVVYNALKEVIDKRRTLFDNQLVKALINIVSIFPLGSLVKLNNNEIGRVIGTSHLHPTRPKVEILLDSRGRSLKPPRQLVLEEEPMVYIVNPAIEEDILKKITREKECMLGKFFDKVKEGLARTRTAMVETIAAVVPMGTRLDDDAIDDIEAALIGADMGLETATEIVDELRERLRNEELEDGPAGVMRVLEEQVAAAVALGTEGALPLEGALPGKPYVVLIVGVNGAGKTTTAGKLAKRYADAGKKVVLAACDTFRAAAIPQLEIWAERAGADLVRAQHGADPAAVAFDALAAAKSRDADVLLVDTAGRLHTKVNLMEELKKIRRSLAKQDPDAPHETLLVLDGTSGQNALVQARQFNAATELTGLALTKLDGTAKGGIVVALRREMDLPVKLICVGEGVDDMQPFDGAVFARALFAE